MEVGKQAADDLELIAGAKEDIGLPRMRLQPPPARNLRAVFQGSRRRGSGGDDAFPRVQRGVYSLRRSRGKRIAFAVKANLRQLLRPNRLEGPKSHVKGNRFDLHA